MPILQMQGGQQFNTDTGQVINPGGQTFNVNTGEGMTGGKINNANFDTTGGTSGASSTPGINTTPLALTPATRADNLLKDYQTPMTVADIRQREADAKEARRREANAIFDPMISQVQGQGEKELGSNRAQLGVSAGMGASTAKLQFLNAVQADIDKRVQEVVKRKEEFISSGDFQSAQLAQQSIEKMQEAANNLILKKAELTLNFMQEDRASAAQAIDTKMALANLDLNTIKTLSDIPVGKKITVNGVTYEGLKPAEKEKPFFSGSDIAGLMKNLPKGQTQTIKDPVTGESITIVGMDNSNPNIMTVEDNQGRVRGIDKTTGAVLWKTEPGVGTVARGNGSKVDTSKMTEAEKAFNDDLSRAVATVTQDPNAWGKTWNYMYTRYRGDLEASAKANGTTVEAVLDQLMNKNMNFPKTEESGGGSVFSNVAKWAQSFSTNESTPATK